MVVECGVALYARCAPSMFSSHSLLFFCGLGCQSFLKVLDAPVYHSQVLLPYLQPVRGLLRQVEARELWALICAQREILVSFGEVLYHGFQDPSHGGGVLGRHRDSQELSREHVAQHYSVAVAIRGWRKVVRKIDQISLEGAVWPRGRRLPRGPGRWAQDLPTHIWRKRLLGQRGGRACHALALGDL